MVGYTVKCNVTQKQNCDFNFNRERKVKRLKKLIVCSYEEMWFNDALNIFLKESNIMTINSGDRKINSKAPH